MALALSNRKRASTIAKAHPRAKIVRGTSTKKGRKVYTLKMGNKVVWWGYKKSERDAVASAVSGYRSRRTAAPAKSRKRKSSAKGRRRDSKGRFLKSGGSKSSGSRKRDSKGRFVARNNFGALALSNPAFNLRGATTWVSSYAMPIALGMGAGAVAQNFLVPMLDEHVYSRVAEVPVLGWVTTNLPYLTTGLLAGAAIGAGAGAIGGTAGRYLGALAVGVIGVGGARDIPHVVDMIRSRVENGVNGAEEAAMAGLALENAGVFGGLALENAGYGGLALDNRQGHAPMGAQGAGGAHGPF